MTLIFNASPIIVLAKAGLIDSFIGLASDILIPQSVADEVVRIPEGKDPARAWMTHSPGRDLVHPNPEIASFVAAWDLGAGESSVISLAKSKPNSMAVLDDLAARRCAQAFGARVIGTLGLVLMAKQRGVLPNVSDALRAIHDAGLFIAPKHIDAIQRQAGE